MKMGPIGCAETLVRNYITTARCVVPQKSAYLQYRSSRGWLYYCRTEYQPKIIRPQNFYVLFLKLLLYLQMNFISDYFRVSLLAGGLQNLQ